jgi:superfamily I DNA/RNA helicase
MLWNAIINGSARQQAIHAAVAEVEVKEGPHPLFQRPIAFFEAELRWLMDHGIVSAEDYEAADRTGRAEARLEREFRATMWLVFEQYLRERSRRGFDYDWNDLAAAAISELAKDTVPRYYRHIVIDEGQDLSPQMLRSLSAAVPANGSITFFGDVAQQIYGHRMSWRSAGLRPPKVWNFSDNYRNSKEIAALGLAIAEMPYYRGLVDIVAPTAPTAAGPLPTLVRFDVAGRELPFVIEQATNLAKTQAVAILVRAVRHVEDLIRALPTGVVNLREETDSWRAGPRLFVGTYHSAKGLEFDAVILPFMSQSHFPDPSTIDDFGLDEAAAIDGRLLYVGVTRARRALIISHTGNPSNLLPTGPGLCTRLTR